MHRRRLLTLLAAGPVLGSIGSARSADDGRPLVFPVDFGSHPETRTEWWYVTGSLEADSRRWGFQVTFFRSATGLASAAAPTAGSSHGPVSASASAIAPSRFRADQLVFAHAAVTDLAQRRLRHDQRIARSGFDIAEARVGDTTVTLRDWSLVRTPQGAAGGLGRYRTRVASDAAGFGFELQFDATQPVLLQGAAGVSRKGPAAAQTSRYYSEPQLAASGRLTIDGRTTPVNGRAWLDHEWSDAFLDAAAVGWDWIGMNLDDGGALTAFRLRRADGSALYAGGSWRAAGGDVRAFGPDEVRFTPRRWWESSASRARYPVAWTVATPVGTFDVDALLDDQELDSRASTGAVYWEGLSALRDADGRIVGGGYLELTGYAASLRL